MEAAYFSLFEPVGKGLGLIHRDLKVLLGGFPLMCRSRGETRDRLREAPNGPKHHRFGAHQFLNERVKLCSLRLLADHDKSLNNSREHPPRTSGVRLAANGQQHALLMKEFYCTVVIIGVSHQS